MNLKEKLKNMWSFQPKSESGEKLGEVLTQGNSFTIRREFEARVNNMLNQIDLSNTNLDSVVYDEYFLLLFQKNYFVNLFDIETSDDNFRKCWNLAVETAFWYGDFAIINRGISGDKESTNLIPVYVAKKTHTPLGDIEKDFEYQYSSRIIPMMGDSKLQSKTPDIKHLGNLIKNNDDFVYGRWNTQAYGAWVWMYKFIKLQKELMYLTTGSAYLQKEILFYKINNTSTVNDEIKMIYNPKMNIIPTMGINWDKTSGELENRWMSDKLSHDPTMTINDVYDWTIQKYYELFGRKMNIDTKRERNISSEVEASQEQFDVLINETKKYLDVALNECKEKFGVEGVMKIDIEVEEDILPNDNEDVDSDN